MNDEHLISTTPGIEPRAPFRDRTYTSSQVRALLDEVLKEMLGSAWGYEINHTDTEYAVPSSTIRKIIQKQKDKL